MLLGIKLGDCRTLSNSKKKHEVNHNLSFDEEEVMIQTGKVALRVWLRGTKTA